MNAKKTAKIISKYNNFLISSHVNPEGDAIGSQIAMGFLLKRLNKKFLILNESPVPKVLRFMPGVENIFKEKKEGFQIKAAIILDCPDMFRIGTISKYISEKIPVINIDHHISNVNFGKYNWVEPDFSSAGEMVFELFKAFKVSIKYEEALAIYIAIMTDTGSFKYSNTSSKNHKIAAELIGLGIKPYDVYTRIYETSSIEDINLLAESLQTLKISGNGKIAWIWITKEMLKKTKGSLEGTEGIINFARSIEGVEVAVLFRETGTENRIKVSFRSKGAADVNKLASFFKGGGHVTASGCSVSGNKEEVEKKVIDKAEGLVSEK